MNNSIYRENQAHRLGLAGPLPAIIVYLKAINVPVNPENIIIGIFVEPHFLNLLLRRALG